jgi:hypothetical protein
MARRYAVNPRSAIRQAATPRYTVVFHPAGRLWSVVDTAEACAVRSFKSHVPAWKLCGRMNGDVIA